MPGPAARLAGVPQSGLITLSGPAGIGKSRMLGALSECVADTEHFRLRYQCSPCHSNIAFYPVIRQLELAADFISSDGIADKLDKLERLLSLSAQDVDAVAPLFATLLHGCRWRCGSAAADFSRASFPGFLLLLNPSLQIRLGRILPLSMIDRWPPSNPFPYRQLTHRSAHR